MATQGELLWAAFLSKITADPRITRDMVADVLVFLELRMGKPERKIRTNQMPLKAFVPLTYFPIPANTLTIFPLKLYLCANYVLRRGQPIIIWKRLDWPWSLEVQNVWTGARRLHFFPPDLRFAKSWVDDVDTRLREALDQVRAKRLIRPFGSYRRSTPLVSPYLVTSNNIIANENTYTPYQQTGLRSYDRLLRYWSGTKTTNFRGKRKGQLPINNYSSTTIITNNGQGYRETSDNLTPRGFSHYWDGTAELFNPYLKTMAVSSSLDSATYNKALAKLIDRAGLDIAGNLAQDFTQFQQTIDLIANTARKLYSSVSALKKGNIPLAVRSLTSGRRINDVRLGKKLSVKKSVAENWLELQYGWKPLLTDIEGSMRSLAELVAGGTSVKEVRARARRSEIVDGIVDDPSYPGHKIGRRIRTRDWICKFGIRYQVDNHLTTFLAQTGFTNPLNLAWEVLPFSFVADWFLPIGPYLSTLSAWDGLTFKDGFYTTYVYDNYIYAVTQKGVNLGYNVWLTSRGYFQRECWVMDRVKLTSFPAARFPVPKMGLTTGHGLNAIALLTGFLKDPLNASFVPAKHKLN